MGGFDDTLADLAGGLLQGKLFACSHKLYPPCPVSGHSFR
jgi:hypothetical protein